jgi:hypothetical protein
MANATMEKPERTEQMIQIQPFTVEADHHRNCDLLLQAIPGCKLRSAVNASRTVTDAKTGEPRIPQDQSAYLGQLPPIPGMQITVDPVKLTYEVKDPLHTDKEFCSRLKSALNHIENNAFKISGELRGIAPQRGTLDVHRMKTLVREISWIVESGDAKVVKGALPTAAEIEKMQGNFLLNPGSTVPNSQPRFERDFPQWVEKLQAMGG